MNPFTMSDFQSMTHIVGAVFLIAAVLQLVSRWRCAKRGGRYHY